MADDMKRRRQIVAAAFAQRRKELDLAQEEVARRARVAVKTVYNFETRGRWPNVVTRTRLEEAVNWPPGEIERLAAAPEPALPPDLIALASQLTDEEREALIRFLQGPRDEGHPQRAAACG